jgi:transcriptional regulator with XRE-family HTH domain
MTASDQLSRTRSGSPVGLKIRGLRRQLRITQSELAARIGVQQSDLSRMERGKYRVSLDTLFRILGEFNMSVSEFFEDPAPVAVTSRELQLAREISRLDPEARREVEAFVAFKRSLRNPDLERATNDD